MSFEAMESLTAVEEQIRKKKAEAAAAAKNRIAEAQAGGERMITDAVNRADGEIREMTRKAEEKALEEAKALADSNENRRAAMLAKAGPKASQAAQFIIERIVNG